MKKLRVWRYDGPRGVQLAAASSRAAAARIFGISDRDLATYGSETHNPGDVAHALKEPGKVVKAAPYQGRDAGGPT